MIPPRTSRAYSSRSVGYCPTCHSTVPTSRRASAPMCPSRQRAAHRAAPARRPSTHSRHERTTSRSHSRRSSLPARSRTSRAAASRHAPSANTTIATSRRSTTTSAACSAARSRFSAASPPSASCGGGGRSTASTRRTLSKAAWGRALRSAADPCIARAASPSASWSAEPRAPAASTTRAAFSSARHMLAAVSPTCGCAAHSQYQRCRSVASRVSSCLPAEAASSGSRHADSRRSLSATVSSSLGGSAASTGPWAPPQPQAPHATPRCPRPCHPWHRLQTAASSAGRTQHAQPAMPWRVAGPATPRRRSSSYRHCHCRSCAPFMPSCVPTRARITTPVRAPSPAMRATGSSSLRSSRALRRNAAVSSAHEPASS